MRLKRETAKKRVAEPPAVRLGLKPPRGGRIKWIRDGFAWDLFVLSPLLGLPLFWRKLHAWGATVLAILLAWFIADRFLSGRIEVIAGIGFANYLLWKLFGTRGIEFAGFLGGLVNSTVTVTELAWQSADGACL